MNMYWPEMLGGPSAPRRRAAYLLLGALLMVVAAWSMDRQAGPLIALLAALYGFIACWMMRVPPAEAKLPPAPATEPPPPMPRDANVALRHDLRGMLSPALMVSDRLLEHPDADVKRAGEVVARTVQRVTDRLAEAKARDSVESAG